MNFVSDNAYGAAPEILEAIAAANDGPVASYGDDPVSGRLGAAFEALFERKVAVFPVITGTAANALALATLCPPHGAVFCHAQSHIEVDECGAPEFFSHGAKLVPLQGDGARLSPETIEQALAHFPKGNVHSVQPAMISITQATERGAVYRPEEIATLSALARRHGMKLHMDGARFANALARLGCSAAEATWRAGVDVMSFGGTKCGALCAEAVVFFDPRDARDFEFRRKRSGHLLSKMRFVSAQLLRMVEDGLWLTLAARANSLADRLAEGLCRVPGVELANPVQANAIFAYVPDALAARLRAEGARFYDWSPPSGGRTLIRLVLSFATPEADLARFIAVASG
jgi:threonine aldolase